MDEDRRASQRIRVGPAGWSYPDWAGQVYPKPQPRGFDPLRYLVRSVDTIEIKSTFYRIPSITMTRNWALRASDYPGVRLPVKRWQGLTHEDHMSAEERGATHGCRIHAGVCPHP
jgi:uncharacterized protein YecE (DUF72 family)